MAQVNVVEQARIEECCGFGGTFSIRFPDISEAIVSDKVDSLRATGTSRVVSADCGCLDIRMTSAWAAALSASSR
jgi:L-lactate dehydrogenase complex protein LldE